MMTCMHQRRRHPEEGETARAGSRVDLSAHVCQEERGNAGRRQAKGSRERHAARRCAGASGCWWRSYWSVPLGPAPSERISRPRLTWSAPLPRSPAPPRRTHFGPCD